MISALRKRSGGIVVKSLLILLMISFGAWGIQDWLSPAISGNTIATVGEDEIGTVEFKWSGCRRARLDNKNNKAKLTRKFLDFILMSACASSPIRSEPNQILNSSSAHFRVHFRVIAFDPF